MKLHSAAATDFDVHARRHRAGSAHDGGGANDVQSNIAESSSLADKPDLEGGGIRLPGIFRGQLSSYQITGMQWLVNLHDGGTNGILADELGLGKTVQTIATLAHIAEVQNEWGPFLVIAPVSAPLFFVCAWTSLPTVAMRLPPPPPHTHTPTGYWGYWAIGLMRPHPRSSFSSS